MRLKGKGVLYPMRRDGQSNDSVCVNYSSLYFDESPMVRSNMVAAQRTVDCLPTNGRRSDRELCQVRLRFCGNRSWPMRMCSRRCTNCMTSEMLLLRQGDRAVQGYLRRELFNNPAKSSAGAKDDLIAQNYRIQEEE